jgi:hypothetical protein
VDEVEARKAAELFDERTGRRMLVALWSDDRVTVCSDGPEHVCYTAERGGKDLYYIIQAFYSGLGMKVRTIHDSEAPAA